MLSLLLLALCIIVRNLGRIGEFLRLASASFYPLIIGAAIAFVFNIFLSFCERHYFSGRTTGFAAISRRPVCLTYSVILTFSIIILIIGTVVPEFVKGIGIVLDGIPGFTADAKEFLLKYTGNYPELRARISAWEPDWTAMIDTEDIVSSVIDVVGRFTFQATRIAIAIIFSVYILAGKSGIKTGFKRAERVYLSNKARITVDRYLSAANYTFRKFFVGQFIEAVVIGVLCTVGMLILRLPYAFVTGTVVGVTALIPIVGAVIGAVMGMFMIFTVNSTQAVIFIIFLILLQQVETNFIYPKVVGSSIGLPGIWVLAAVTVGGGMFGVSGMLFGVPVLATVYKLVYEDIDNREILQQANEEMTEASRNAKKDGSNGLHSNT